MRVELLGNALKYPHPIIWPRDGHEWLLVLGAMQGVFAVDSHCLKKEGLKSSLLIRTRL